MQQTSVKAPVTASCTNCFAKLIVVFYHVCADIQRPLLDAPWFGVTGCTTFAGQITGWKLNTLQQDVMGINVFPALFSATVTV